MSHQITLEELGLIPDQKKYDRSVYACPCGGCVCGHCANNVDCDDIATGEADFPCFNCDDCINYNGDRGTDNWKPECGEYKVTNAYAQKLRKRFANVNMDSIIRKRGKGT